VSFGLDHLRQPLGFWQHRAQAEDYDIAAIADHLSLADFKRHRMLLYSNAGTDSARIADSARAVVIQHRGIQHVLQLVFVLWNHVDDVRNAAQVADVEEAVMRRAVVATESAAVHAEDDREILQRYIMHYLVEGTLQECRVDRAEGLVTLGRHAG